MPVEAGLGLMDEKFSVRDGSRPFEETRCKGCLFAHAIS